MDVKLTLGGLVAIIGVTAFVILCTYLVITIRNLNKGVKVLKKLLEDNKDNIDAALKDVPDISKNLVEITFAAKEELKIVENALSSINETVEMTAAAAGTIRHGFFGKLKRAVGFVNMAGKVLFRGKRKWNIKKDT